MNETDEELEQMAEDVATQKVPPEENEDTVEEEQADVWSLKSKEEIERNRVLRQIQKEKTMEAIRQAAQQAGHVAQQGAEGAVRVVQGAGQTIEDIRRRAELQKIRSEEQERIRMAKEIQALELERQRIKLQQEIEFRKKWSLAHQPQQQGNTNFAPMPQVYSTQQPQVVHDRQGGHEVRVVQANVQPVPFAGYSPWGLSRPQPQARPVQRRPARRPQQPTGVQIFVNGRTGPKEC